MSDEEYETQSSTAPETPSRQISQRENKGVSPQRLVYKVQTSSFKESQTWTKMLQPLLQMLLPLREHQPWITAAEEKMKFFNEHHVWELTNFPSGKRTITCK